MSSRSLRSWAAVATLLGMLMSPDGASAQTGAYYNGRQIRLVIGSGVGGGYDVFARFLARHLAKHIPGNPTVISQNMPAASPSANNESSVVMGPRFRGDDKRKIVITPPPPAAG